MATSSAGTLVKDPITGAYTLAPGAGDNPIGAVSVGDLGIGNPPPLGGNAPGPQGNPGDPISTFNKNIASILTQIQTRAGAGRDQLAGAANALTNESVGAAGAYDPTATPGVNLGSQKGMLGAFQPAISSINTQLQNADAAIKDLESTIGTIQSANEPQVLSPGQSQVTKGGQVISQGHSYSPQINPSTGMTDGFDANTGTWASQEGGSSSSGSGSQSGGENLSGNDAIDLVFGSKNPIGAYATDPNYTKEISGLYSTISAAGVANAPDTLQQYINNHAKSAPVTGQMILNASSTYNIDPALLTTVLMHESDFGTTGAARTTMNPGNQGNTGTSTKAFSSWQQGVLATASNIANRIDAASKASATTNQPAATTAIGGDFNPIAAQKVAKLPQYMQKFTTAGPLGVAYINQDQVKDLPAGTLSALTNMAAQVGIPYVQAADVNALKAITAVLQNLDSMEALADKNLYSGTSGHAIDTILGGVNRFLQTDWGNQLGLFDNYRDTAIKAVQALAGGAGSGLRINGAEIAANTQNLPQAGDSKENASLQIKQLRQLIYTQLGTSFPYAPVKVVDPNGQTGTVPASNLASAIAKGYTVK